LSDIADKAAQKIENFKDFQGGDLDTQWCILGGHYLQYLHAYNPLDGNLQLENLTKFFTCL